MLNIPYNISISNRTMAQLHVRGLAFTWSLARLFHIIIHLRALESNHIQINTSVLIVLISLLLVLLCEVLTRYESQLDSRISIFKQDYWTNKVWLKSYTTKSPQVTECQIIISRKSASKNQTSDLLHYLNWRQEKPTIATE